MTESTEHGLGPEHLAGCLALSRAANWNQNAADWRLMLEMGHGWGISEPDGTLAASTLVLPYGGFAWVSMVLVLPKHRRKGYASRLLRVAIADLYARGLTPMLDATPAGREVYRQEGFQDRWGYKRFYLKGADRVATPKGEVRNIRESDWPEILQLDAQAFGASREHLLRALHQRLPQAALMIEGKGFVLGRDRREARQIGPLVARDELTARNLLTCALGAVEPPLYIDAVDHSPWLHLGLEFQRPFTRMTHGPALAPGIEKLVYLVAGPELG